MKRILPFTFLCAASAMSFADPNYSALGKSLTAVTPVAKAAVGKRISLDTQVTRGTRDALRRANTFWGATGLIFVPTAYVAREKEAQIGAALGNDFSTATATYGIVRDVEIGAAYLDRADADNKVVGTAKVRIIPANFNWLEIGVGILDIADAVDRTVYVVGSADLITPPAAAEEGALGLRVHAGMGNGMFEDKLFAGGELFFENGFSIIGEWDTKNTNVALRYLHDNEFTIDLGSYAKKTMLKLTYNMRFNGN